MTGIIVQLALSWLIIWLYERNNLKVLGFFPTTRRLKDFALFLLVSALCSASGFLMKIYFGGVSYQLNPVLSAGLILDGLWWNIKSVLFEELIFRGVLLYILVQKLGIFKAVVISSIAFGMYHWFSFGILGQVPQMIFVFFLTGLMGMVYAWGYARTMSLYIPCAIHLGWNFTLGFVFSEGSIGGGIYSSAETFRTDNYTIYLMVTLVPMLSVMLVNFLLLKRKKQVRVDVYKKRHLILQ